MSQQEMIDSINKYWIHYYKNNHTKTLKTHLMTIVIDPKTVESALKEGLSKLGIVSKEFLDKAEILVYRKGKKIAAKIILK